MADVAVNKAVNKPQLSLFREQAGSSKSAVPNAMTPAKDTTIICMGESRPNRFLSQAAAAKTRFTMMLSL